MRQFGNARLGAVSEKYKEKMTEPSHVVLSVAPPAAAPAVTKRAARRAKQRANKQKGTAKKKEVPLVEDVQDTVTRTLSEMNNVLLVLFVGIVVYTHKDDFGNGPMADFLTDTGRFGTWVKSNVYKSLGAMLFIPVILTMNEKNRYWRGALLIGAIVCGPALALFDYGLLAMVVHVALNLRNKRNRTLVFLMALAYVYYRNMSSTTVTIVTQAPNTAPPVKHVVQSVSSSTQ